MQVFAPEELATGLKALVLIEGKLCEFQEWDHGSKHVLSIYDTFIFKVAANNKPSTWQGVLQL